MSGRLRFADNFKVYWHSSTEVEVFDIINVGPRHRFAANGLIVSNCFGMWWKKFIVYAKTQYGIEFTEQEARATREAFFARYSSLAPWHDATKAFARRHGYVRSYSGTVRHLDAIWSEDEGIQGEAGRQSVNSPVQNFASDLGLMAFHRIESEVDTNILQIVGFVHDALYAYVPEQYVEWGAKTLKHYMETNPLEEWFNRQMRVPIVADVSFGWNAGDTHEMKGLELDRPFDFARLATNRETGEVKFTLPPQQIPPNNGRVATPLYMQVSQ